MRNPISRYLKTLAPLPKAFSFLLCYLILSGLCVLGFAQFLPKQWFWFAWGLSASLAALVLYRRYIRSDKEKMIVNYLLMNKRSLPRFFAGFGIGICILFVTTLLLIYLLPLQLVLVKNVKLLGVLGWSAALLFCAFHEEVGFRSYFLQKLASAKGIWIAQLIIALAFALYHIAGGQDVINSLLSTSLWSVIFGLAALYSRGLAMPTGIHAASTMCQAFLSMKINDGFQGFLTLQPTRAMPDNVRPVVLVSQAAVLIIAIILLWYMMRRRPTRRLFRKLMNHLIELCALSRLWIKEGLEPIYSRAFIIIYSAFYFRQ